MGNDQSSAANKRQRLDGEAAEAGTASQPAAEPGGGGIGILPTLGLIIIVAILFEYSAVFHNAMLPGITPVNKLGFVSGLAFSLGNVGGVLLMLFVLLAFSLPGTIDWSFLPATALFGAGLAGWDRDQPIHG